MEDKKVLLSIKDLQVKFRVRGRILTAIRGVTLDIYENESIAIVGESGAGKSVFTKAFAGMLDSNGFIDQGDIIFNDDELSDTVVPLNSYAKKTIAPIKAFDDNRFTYLKFKEQTDFPAAYRVQDGEETLLNSHVEDGWLVLHGVYEEVRLRAGKAVVGIYNENYQGGGASDKRAVSVKGLYRQIKHKE